MKLYQIMNKVLQAPYGQTESLIPQQIGRLN